MLLEPADFYSYSRATGTKPPENDRERAAIATDVIDFKRSQLKAPSQGDEGRDLGLVALGAGILGSIIGGRKISQRFGGAQTAPKKVSFDPGPETKKAAKRATQRNNQKLQKDLNEVEPSKIVESPTVVEKQQIDNTATSAQQVNSRGVTEQVNRDIRSVREGKTDKLKAEAILKATQNSDFANFNQDVVKLQNELATQKAAVQKLEDQIFAQEAKEQAFAKAAVASMQDVRSPMAFDLTGRASDMGLSKKELRRLELKGDEQFFGTDLSERERIQRISLAGDDRVSERQRRMLLDPSVSAAKLTKEGLLDLGDFQGNPNFELRAGGTSDINVRYRGTPDTSMGESNVSNDKLEYLQKQREEKIGAAGITGVYEGVNPEYERLTSEFSKNWDQLAANKRVLPRRQIIDGKEVTYQELKNQIMSNPNADPVLKEQFIQSGQTLRVLAQSMGLDQVPETTINVTNTPLLKEVVTTREKGRKGTKTILTDQTQYEDFGLTGENQLRQQRQIRRENLQNTVTPIRGQGGIVYDETGKATFVKSRVSSPGQGAAAQIGGYKTGEPIEYYDFKQVEVIEDKVVPIISGLGMGTNIRVGTTTTPGLSSIPTKKFDVSEDILNIQPYGVNKLVKQKTALSNQTGKKQGETFVSPTVIYGPLVEAVTEGGKTTYKGTKLRLSEMQDMAARVKASIPENILREDPKTYYGKIADKLYVTAKNPSVLSPEQTRSGMIPGVGKDLPVLKDFSAKQQFAKDLLNVEKESPAYGRRVVGLDKKDKFGRYQQVKKRGTKMEETPLVGVTRQAGFGTTDPNLVEAGKIRVDIGGGQRAAGAQKLRQALQDFKARTGQPVSRSQLFKLAQPLARQYNTDINSLINLAGSRRGGGLRG
tara:strand:- start:3467 stop:6106 length:2640 start_codon:yes stop_codon:yes gene_type:complete